MNLLIIGANGRQGAMLCREACDRGHTVTAVIRSGAVREPRVARVLHKDLFALTAEDLSGTEAVISAFGAGLDADPRINREAINYLMRLCGETGVRLLINGGAGSLFSDATHRTRVWELPEHPAFLRAISAQMTRGLEDLQKTEALSWTYVCPSLSFSYEGQRTGCYQTGGEEVLYAADGKSDISYADFAIAMIDEAETNAHPRLVMTVCRL